MRGFWTLKVIAMGSDATPAQWGAQHAYNGQSLPDQDDLRGRRWNIAIASTDVSGSQPQPRSRLSDATQSRGQVLVRDRLFYVRSARRRAWLLLQRN